MILLKKQWRARDGNPVFDDFFAGFVIRFIAAVPFVFPFPVITVLIFLETCVILA